MSMDRRAFLATGIAAGAASVVATASQANALEAEYEKKKFKMKYAPHFGMFAKHAGKDLVDQLKFAADEGFHAWEDNGMMNRSIKDQDRCGKAMEELGITMGVFCSYLGFGKTEFVTKTDKEFQGHLRKVMTKAIDTAKRVNAQWTTVVPGIVNLKLEEGYQMANCVTNLRMMSQMCEKANLVMVLEPLNWWANHAGLYLRKIPQAYAICKAVNSPSCKILDDLYHQQIQEGNLIPNMQKAWDEIAYIQVGDNPGRKEPLTGEINFRNVFKWLNKKGFKGVIGMEHGNSQRGKEGERKVINAYRWCDDFLNEIK